MFRNARSANGGNGRYSDARAAENGFAAKSSVNKSAKVVLFPPPTPRERRHRRLACRRVAVGWRAVFVVARWETPWLWTLAAALADHPLLSPD
jgi:hypothetical protein